MTEKICRRCQRPLQLEEFPANKRTRDGKSSWCKACHREATRRSRAKPGRAEKYRRREIEAGRLRPPPEPMPCRQCGKEFQPSRRGNVYCSKDCVNGAVYARRRARWEAEQRRERERRRYADDVRLLGQARADELARERAERREARKP